MKEIDVLKIIDDDDDSLIYYNYIYYPHRMFCGATQGCQLNQIKFTDKYLKYSKKFTDKRIFFTDIFSEILLFRNNRNTANLPKLAVF